MAKTAPKSRPRKYTPEEIKKIESEAPRKIAEMDKKSIGRTKRKIEDYRWREQYKRKLT